MTDKPTNPDRSWLPASKPLYPSLEQERRRRDAAKVFWFVVRWTSHNSMPQYVAGPYGSEEDATAASRTAVMSGSVVTIMSTAPQEVPYPTPPQQP